MELPDWVADEIPARLKGGTGFLVMVKLFRHGRPQVDNQGRRRVYWAGNLGKLTLASRGALDPAVRQLMALGALRVHEPLRASSPRGYSVPVDVPGWGVVPAFVGAGVSEKDTYEAWGVSEKSTPCESTVSEKDTPREFRAQANGGGGEYLSSSRTPSGVFPDQDLHHHHSPGIPREAILSTLAAMEFNGAGGFLATHGPMRVGGALLELWGEIEQGEYVHSFPGWLRSAVQDRDRAFEQPAEWGFLEAMRVEVAKTPEEREWERRKASATAPFGYRYIGGLR